MELTKTCLLVAPDVCADLSFEIPVWELLITVLVTAAVTAITIRWSVRAARRETLHALRVNARAEIRARRERADEIAAEIARSELRERGMLVGNMMALVTRMSELVLLPPKNRRRAEVEASWKAMRSTFEVSPLPDALELYSFADLRMKKAVRDRARADQGATDFVLSHLFTDEIRHAGTEWVESGRLSQRTRDAFAKLEAQDNADRAARVEALLQRVGALDVTFSDLLEDDVE